MRIGIYLDYFKEWGGGVDFLRIILKGLEAVKGDYPAEYVGIIPHKKKSRERQVKDFVRSILFTFTRLEKFRNNKAMIDPDGIKKTLHAEAEMTFVEFNYTEKELRRIVTDQQIDVVLPVFESVGKGAGFPWVGYLYDFQHKYFPHFFTPAEISIRDQHFKRMLGEARVIIVNSRSVKNDAEKFFPGHKALVISLPFCPLYDTKPKQASADLSSYHLPRNFFMISNQFWQHKDHRTAFKALKLFYESGGDPSVELVCTGIMYDYRSPAYIDELKKLTDDDGLKNKIHLLGYIPKADQHAMMQACRALIQPTLFEGGPGGGSVYEAIALGLPVVLSDIAVNKEIDDDHVLFFEAGNENDLAAKMKDILHFARKSEEDTMRNAARRQRALGSALHDAIKLATETAHW